MAGRVIFDGGAALLTVPVGGVIANGARNVMGSTAFGRAAVRAATTVDLPEFRTPSYFPDRKLPRTKNGVPMPDSTFPHTQLGTKPGRKGSYPQAREFDAAGKPVRDIDFTDHGRPDIESHTNPHQHIYNESSTGGTLQRGDGVPFDPFGG